MLKAKKTWKHLVKQAEAGGTKVAADDKLYDLYAALNKIKSDDDLHKQMHQALMNGDKQKAADLISNNNYKSGLGSAVLKFEKVAYSEANDLVQRAINFRKSLGSRGGGKTHHSASGSNVAVFEYIDKAGNIAYKEVIATDVGEDDQIF